MKRTASMAALALIVACGGTPASPFASTTITTGIATTGVSTTNGTATTSTTQAETTTTAAETTTTTAAPFGFDLDSIVPTPPAPLTGLDAVIAESPNDTLGAALTQSLRDAGVDLTGVTITVWPVSGTGTSLLMLAFDEAAQSYAAEDGGESADLLGTLMASPLIDAATITRVVVRYADADEQGPFVLVAVSTVEGMRASLAGGDAGEVLLSIERETP